MLRRTIRRLWMEGIHVPRGTNYQGARMKHWPTTPPPKNLNLTREQRLRMEALPRDVGMIPRDFVLNVLYLNQPCEVDKLWEMCTEDPTSVMESKRHLRAVLKQCREEGFVYFERDTGTDGWICLLTRERFEEVRAMAKTAAENATPASVSVLRGSAVAETAAIAEKFESFDEETQKKHAAELAEAVKATNEAVRKYQRTEIDYLPYTDINGKVNFMWWYDVRDAAMDAKGAEALSSPEQSDSPKELPSPAGL